jgi:hypothetical protein
MLHSIGGNIEAQLAELMNYCGKANAAMEKYRSATKYKLAKSSIIKIAAELSKLRGEVKRNFMN